VGVNIPVNQYVNGFSNTTGRFIQGEEISYSPIKIFTINNILLVLYFIVSAILLLRFVLNIFRIIKKARFAIPVDYLKAKIVLTNERTLPYSFFRYIIVNRSDYENGKINNELLIHEQTHCLQYHSVDILLIEFLKTVFWFNPILWLFKKAIQLNHEYLADDEVLAKHNINDYQSILLNLVLRNNSTYLASNFHYSLTKKRLIMMTKNNCSRETIFRKIAVIPLVVILAVTLTFGKEIKSQDNFMNFENEWWYPILTKHKIELTAFNNFEDVFEMGTSNSVNNRRVTLKDALFLIRSDGDKYTIIRSPLAYHDLDKKYITGEVGLFETYSLKQKDLNPIEKIEMKNFKYQINDRENSFRADKFTIFE
jgi:hypothetical protein